MTNYFTTRHSNASKKEELYARHTKAVNELAAVEEVMSNVGTEV